MAKFWTREFWTPKLKSPEKILFNLLNALESHDDDIRARYLEKHMAVIKHAMLDAPDYDLFQSSGDSPLIVAQQNYFDWYHEILTTIYEQGEGLNTSNFPHSAKYFMDAMQAETKNAFDILFANRPADAIHTLTPAMVFQNDILDKMKLLSTYEDPALYFECFSAIDLADDQADTIKFTNRLVDLTLTALNKLIQKDPDAVFFAEKPGYIVASYLDYLPDCTCKTYFINDHLDMIVAAAQRAITDVQPHHAKEFKTIYNAVPPESRPQELEDLQKLMISARIQKTFHLAAQPNLVELSKIVVSFDDERCDHIKTYTVCDERPNASRDAISQAGKPNRYSPTYEFVHIENPDEAAEDTELWMIRKANTILMASFTQSAVVRYLESQTGHVTGELPTVQEFDTFYRNSTTGRLPQLT